MRNKEKLFSIALTSASLVLFLILISSVASASTVQNSQLTINETQITTNTSDQYYPNIYGDTFVWFDIGNGRWDLYTYNLSTSKETLSLINGTMPYHPLIYNDRIVWGDSSPTNVNSNEYYLLPVIYMYDLSTSRQTRISGNAAAMCPAIYGDRIVWMDSRNSGKWDYLDSTVNWNIYMYNVSTSKETRLFSNKSMKMFPAIYKDKIVWMDSRNGGSGNYWNLTGNWDIYMYNLSTHKGTQITTDPSSQMYPAIYEDTIVWIDSRNGNWEIYGYNLTTCKEIKINTIGLWHHHSPSIYGNRIVWMDTRNRDWEVYMYDLSTSREVQITTNSSHSQSPASPEIYGNRIVWESMRNGNRDIYMYTVSGENKGLDAEQQSKREGNKSKGDKNAPEFKTNCGIFSLLGVF